MKRVLIIGAGKGGTALIHIIRSTTSMEVVCIIDRNESANGIGLAKKLQIPTGTDWREWLHKDIDIIMEVTGDETILQEIIDSKPKETLVIPGAVAYVISQLVDEKTALLDQIKQQMDDQELILNHIGDGMIVIDREQTVQFVNGKAVEIVGQEKESFVGIPITEVIKNSQLPDVLQTLEKEINQKFTLDNGRQIVCNRIPLISDQNQLIGAFTVFKDITEVVKLAEENTDLNEIKNLLEAIIKSSYEAISVVDEKGNGIMINPAYTKITGLTEKDILGKPASVDIHEGESMHMKVLQTGKSVNGVRMKVGQFRKDVIVNVAPIIVNEEIRGSVGVLHDVSEIKTLTKELKRAQQIIRSLEAKYSFNDIIGSSPELTLALEQAKVGAKTPALVLLRGESGTGKELFAHAIHNESERSHQPFIRVNCAAIDETLLEIELFGSEADKHSTSKEFDKIGAFEKANYGSIFLDEISELSLNMQLKLLRVIQEQEIMRVGGTEAIQIDVRIITATNVNLERAIMNRKFREDLYYRLSRLPIFIPSLNERIQDIPELVNHLLQKLNNDYGRNIQSVEADALELFNAYNWPGNVRELENVLGRAMINMDIYDETILKEHLPKLDQSLLQEKDADFTDKTWDPLNDAVDKFEKGYIAEIYKRNNFNKTKTAQVLNISLRNLYYKIDKYQLD